MKKNRPLNAFCLAVCALGLLLYFFPQKAEAYTSVSFNLFYDSLDPYGDWVYIEPYGYCWEPEVDDADWRPYGEGYWAYTDCGWTWVSDEPWGWATYHYGRWVHLEGHRWAWVPGYEWGPAWVSWRYSDEYIGWAPLPPEAVWEPRSGFGMWVDLRFDIGPSYYNFCEVRHFGSSRLRSVILSRDRNATVINKTVNVTKIVYNNSTVYNGGPDLQAVNQRSSSPIERLRLERREDLAGNPRAERSGNRLEVFAPTVRPPAESEHPRNVEGRISKSHVDRGWDIGNAETSQELRSQYKNEARGLVSVPVRTDEQKTSSSRKAGSGGSVAVERATRISAVPSAVEPDRSVHEYKSKQKESQQGFQSFGRSEKRVQNEDRVVEVRTSSRQTKEKEVAPSFGPSRSRASEEGLAGARERPAGAREFKQEKQQADKQAESTAPDRPEKEKKHQQ